MKSRTTWAALLLILLPAVARADAQSDAREELDRRGVEYTASAMCDAAGEGDVEVVRLFLDASDENVDLRDYSWMTPLLNATLWSRSEVVRLLLERGADPDLADSSGETALHYAVIRGWNEFDEAPQEGQPEIVRALLDAGADVNARTEKGETPLLIAARTGDQGAFDMLVAHGANLDLADGEGDTPVAAAVREAHPAMVRALVERGAKVSWWLRIEYYLYRFARIQGWSMPFLLVLIAVAVTTVNSHRPPLPSKEEIGAGDGLPRLEPLQCAKCAATVPIDEPSGQCPSCGMAFTVPEDYTETVRLRRNATENLRRAIQMWRRARLWNSPPVALAFLLLGPVWLVGTYVGAVGDIDDHSGLMIASTLVGGWTFGAALFCYGVYLVSERLAVPPVPKLGRALGGDEEAGCTQCGGGVLLPKGAFAVACDFCGSHIFRPAFARTARGAAAEEQYAAEALLVGALTSLYDMRDTLVSGVFVSAFLVTGTALVIVGLAVIEYLKELVGL